MVDIHPAAAEIRRGKKEEEEEERNYRAKILWSALFHRATITTHLMALYWMSQTSKTFNSLAPCLCSYYTTISLAFSISYDP